MESKASIRRLLAGSSLVALLAASNVVLNDGRAYAARATGVVGVPISPPGLGAFPTTASAFTTAASAAHVSAGATALEIALPASYGTFENTLGALAVAKAYASGATAVATADALGVHIEAAGSIEDIINNATIQAFASAKATGTSSGYAIGHARAQGLAIEVLSADVLGGISNLGDIYTTAIVHSTPVGAPPPPAATATGISIHLTGSVTAPSTGFENDGLVQAIAIDPGQAAARGIVLDGGWYEGDLINSGQILARAEATAEGGSAVATALKLQDPPVMQAARFGGEIVNSGVIEALATADHAHAIGLHLQDGAYSDGKLDNSGMIVAVASGLSAFATAVKVEDGGSLGGTISNTGIIGTSVNGKLGGGVAIDLEGAGDGTTIEQLGAISVSATGVAPGLYGDVLLANGDADTIEWSGGKMVGNVHGDNIDKLDVFAGTASYFAFDGNINVLAVTTADGTSYAGDAQSFGTIDVNTASHADTGVSLALGGRIYAEDLNVNHNGTLELKPTATVEVQHLLVQGTGASQSAGTIQWDLKPTAPEHPTVIAETVTIEDGAKSVAHALPGLFKAHEDFLVIESTDITGDFAFSEDFTNLYNVTDRIEADGYHIIIDRLAFQDIPGLNPNGQAAGAGIDKILDELNRTNADGPLATLLGQVLIGTPEQYAHAMNELAGSQNGDLLQAAMSDPGQLLNVIFEQLGGGGAAGLAGAQNSVLVADNSSGATASDVPPAYASLALPSPVAQPLSVWLRAFGNWASLDRDPGSGASGFTSHGGGVVAGATYRFSDNWLAGVAGGYQRNNVDFRGTGDANVNSYSLSVHGRYESGNAYVNALAGASRESYSMTRLYTPMSTTYAARRSPDGETFMAGIEGGIGYDLGGQSKVTPFVGFDYSHMKIDGSTETGSGPGNLTVADQSANNANSRLGLRWTKVFDLEGGSELTPTIEAGWKHQFADTNPTTTAALSGLPGSSFTVHGASAPRDLAVAGAGLSARLSDRLDASIRYDGDFGSGYTNSTASLRLTVRF